MTKSKVKNLVEKVGNAEDESTGDAFEIFRFKKVWGVDGEIRIPRDRARDPEFVNSLLILKNADLPYPNGQSVPIVLQAIQQPAEQQSCMPRVWVGGLVARRSYRRGDSRSGQKGRSSSSRRLG
jgi:hypothetical protein